MAISEDDKYIVSGSGNGEIRVWNALSGVVVIPEQYNDGMRRQGNLYEDPCTDIALLSMP